MKHIQKKYLFEDRLTELLNDKNLNYQEFDAKKIDRDILKKNYKTHNVIMETSEKEKIFAFIHNHHGKHIVIPMPDFTLVYYDFAYKLNIQRKEFTKEIFEKLSEDSSFTEVNSNLLYNFYGYSSSCIINLFTCLESFINSLLGSDKEFVDRKNNRTEIYNREQIQQYLSFLDKLKKVLPQFHNKNFFLNSTPTNQHIIKLKDLRDKIIHTKSDSTGDSQIEIFKLLLNFKYEETFASVSKLINFYKDSYIVECPCDKDF